MSHSVIPQFGQLLNPIISTEDLKQFFEVFVVEWHYMNILKDNMYYFMITNLK